MESNMQQDGIGVSAISRDDDVAVVSIKNPPARPGVAYFVFSALAEAEIDVDIILQTESPMRSNDIVFTIHERDSEKALSVLEKAFADTEETSVVVDSNAVKLSVSGAGMQGKPGVAARVFKCLWNADVEIINISTSEIKISMLIRKEDADAAQKALYENFAVVL